ncbi:DNA replication/repair protein RecF [Devosia enhydra]|nr:DNA replication/repair protein RecF [Devosia enhydra]
MSQPPRQIMGYPHLSRLRLSQFRNYAHAALDLDGRHVVLTGPNGAGKTNLLEAISLLAPGRGLRRAPFETLANQAGDSGWAVATTVEGPEGPVDIGTGMSPGDSSRRVRINGANARTIEEMSAYLRVIWLTPAMDGLFTGPAGDRRRFLDTLVTTLVPGHTATVSAFDTAMRQRNRLLSEPADPLWLDAIEAQMAEAAAALHFARTDAVGHLQDLLDRSLPDDAFPSAHLALTPLLPESAPEQSSALETVLRSLWRSDRDRDRAAGRTLVGPHRIDLEVVHAQKSMPAALGSTGEQKAMLIGLVLAQARLVRSMSGLAPLLLLDEVAAHLDPGRRAQLFLAIDALGSQCFMTGTDAILFEALGERAEHVHVEGGRLRR